MLAAQELSASPLAWDDSESGSCSNKEFCLYAYFEEGRLVFWTAVSTRLASPASKLPFGTISFFV